MFFSASFCLLTSCAAEVNARSAFSVLPFRRTCQELPGSEATVMLRYGIVKNE